jgi:tetratricopeptide (TPR) repeat protein
MTIPKSLLPYLAILALTPTLSAQDENAPVPEWQQKLENLSPEDKKSYATALGEGSRLFNQKRIFEALNSVYDAEKIFPQNPAALNLKGACYVEFRDFTRARACFDEAIALTPGNPSVLFNLVEMDFVTRQWEACQKRIQELSPLIPKDNIAMHRLLEFKLMLTYLKTDQEDKARELSEKYDFLDDNPYYYYAQAAICYHDGETEKADTWIGSARRVFRDAATLSPWQDTLIEFGYIKSFYGDGLGVVDPSE